MTEIAVPRRRWGTGRLLAIGLLLYSPQASVKAQDQKPSFKSGRQIVEIDVRVLDGSGHFVPGLSMEDFTLLENAVPQQIQAMYLVSKGTVAASSTGTSDSVRPNANQTWLFLFDTPHLTAAGLARTRDAVKAFLGNHLRDGDLVGVVVNGRMVNNRISSTKEEIARAIASVTQAGDLTSRRLELRTWPRLMDVAEARRIVDNDQYALDIAVRRACEDEPDACRVASPDLAVREKASRILVAERTAAKQTLDTVTALSSGLARIPGPKTVVMLSEGFVLDGLESLLAQAVGQAARAGARFYTIDARGLNRGAGTDNLDRPLADDPAVGTRFDLQSDGTNSLGVDTGGMAIRNENNFGRALDEIDRDSATYYVLVYSPSNEAFDGKYRSIDVQVKRPNVKVRARRGYLALAPAKMLVPIATATPAPASAAPEIAAPTPPADVAKPTVSSPELSPPPSPPKMPVAPPEVPAPPTNAARTRVNAGELVMELAGEAGHSKAAGAPDTEGWAAYERGDVTLAARLLNEAASRPDARPWVHYASGFANLAVGRPADAARAWEVVRARVPQFQPVYFDLADAYLQLEDEGKAVSTLRAAQQRWPSDSDINNALGVAQVKRGALDDAIDSFGKAIAAAPSESLGYFNLARAYHLRYFKSHRYNAVFKKWMGNDHDREVAAINFQKYIDMGGPYVQLARDALATLAWK